MIVCIDPGTSNTGVVSMDRAKVYGAGTWMGHKAVGLDNEAVLSRCAEIAQFVGRTIDRHVAEVTDVVIEGFVTWRGQRGNAYTFQTPMLVGYLCRFIEDRYPFVNIHIQLSRDVLAPNRAGSFAWVKEYAKDGREILPGSNLCTNDHTRSALAHGCYFLMIERPEYEQ